MQFLLCILALCISLSTSKVVDPKYNEADERVKLNSVSVDQIVQVDKNEVALAKKIDKVKPESQKEKASLPVKEEYIVKYETILYKEKKNSRMVEVIYSENDIGHEEMIDCFLIGDETLAKQISADIPAQDVKTIEKKAMSKLIEVCSSFLLSQFEKGELHSRTKNNVIPESGLNRGFLDGLFIFPGTKWCGAGDVADHYEDLGHAKQADLCCRTHDHCNDSIPSRGEKYGLKNRALYTSSHCGCDREFQQCLLKTNNFVSNTIGCLYYNLLQTKCFELNYPVSKCVTYDGWIPWIHWSCQEYTFDTNANKMWQFFDAKRYNAPDSYTKYQPNMI